MELQAAFLTTTEAARILRVSVYTLRQWRNKGKGPVCSLIGRQVLYNSTDVQNFFSDCKICKEAIR